MISRTLGKEPKPPATPVAWARDGRERMSRFFAHSQLQDVMTSLLERLVHLSQHLKGNVAEFGVIKHGLFIVRYWLLRFGLVKLLNRFKQKDRVFHHALIINTLSAQYSDHNLTFKERWYSTTLHCESALPSLPCHVAPKPGCRCCCCSTSLDSREM